MVLTNDSVFCFGFNNQNPWNKRIYEPGDQEVQVGMDDVHECYSHNLALSPWCYATSILISIQRRSAGFWTQRVVHCTESWDFHEAIFSFWWHQTYRKKKVAAWLTDWSCLSMEKSLRTMPCVCKKGDVWNSGQGFQLLVMRSNPHVKVNGGLQSCNTSRANKSKDDLWRKFWVTWQGKKPSPLRCWQRADLGRNKRSKKVASTSHVSWPL